MADGKIAKHASSALPSIERGRPVTVVRDVASRISGAIEEIASQRVPVSAQAALVDLYRPSDEFQASIMLDDESSASRRRLARGLLK